MKIHKSNLSDFLIKMNIKGEQEPIHTPKHELKAFIADPADVLPAENSSKQGSPATMDSPVQGELFQACQEPFKLPEASSATRPAESFEPKPLGELEAVTRKVSLMTSFGKAAGLRKESENGSIDGKDTDRAGIVKSLFKSPFQSSPPRQASAFQFVKSNECGIAYLRSKICSATPPAQSTSPHDGPRLMAPIPSLRPVMKLPMRVPESIMGNLPAFTGYDAEPETQPTAYSVIKISNLKVKAKRLQPEDDDQQFMVEDCKNGDLFQCKHCGKCFTTGQALGGHMSRKHSGKSMKYNYKKDVRKKREFERMKLYMAKKRYFESLGHNYEQMVQTPDGKMRAKTLINRSRIKKIKSLLTDEEVYNYFESHQ